MKKKATVKQTIDLMQSILREHIYCFELTLYNGFLNSTRKVRFNIKTAYPESVTESDFREKIINYGASYGKRMKDFKSVSIKFIAKIGL